MARVRKIQALTFRDKDDPELIAKLNTLAPYMYRNVHDLARSIMLEFCDKKIRELGITVDYTRATQSAGAG